MSTPRATLKARLVLVLALPIGLAMAFVFLSAIAPTTSDGLRLLYVAGACLVVAAVWAPQTVHADKLHHLYRRHEDTRAVMACRLREIECAMELLHREFTTMWQDKAADAAIEVLLPGTVGGRAQPSDHLGRNRHITSDHDDHQESQG